MKGLTEVIVAADFRGYKRNKLMFRQGWCVGEMSDLYLPKKASQKPKNYYFLISPLSSGADQIWLRHTSRSFSKFCDKLKWSDFSNWKSIPVHTSQKQSVWCHSSVNHTLETKCIVFSCAGKCNRLVTIKILDILRNSRTSGRRANSLTGNICMKLFLCHH